MFNFRKTIAVVATLATAALVPGSATAQIYKGETAGVGDPVHTMFVTFANPRRSTFSRLCPRW